MMGIVGSLQTSRNIVHGETGKGASRGGKGYILPGVAGALVCNSVSPKLEVRVSEQDG